LTTEDDDLQNQNTEDTSMKTNDENKEVKEISTHTIPPPPTKKKKIRKKTTKKKIGRSLLINLFKSKRLVTSSTTKKKRTNPSFSIKRKKSNPSSSTKGKKVNAKRTRANELMPIDLTTNNTPKRDTKDTSEKSLVGSIL